MKVMNCHTLTEMCEAALDGEPVFIIRAQDKLSRTLIANYIDEARSIGAKNIGRVKDVLKKTIEWQDKNPNRIKVPD